MAVARAEPSSAPRPSLGAEAALDSWRELSESLPEDSLGLVEGAPAGGEAERAA